MEKTSQTKENKAKMNSIDQLSYPEYFFMVYNWMISDLELKGAELAVYAVVFRCSELGVGAYYASLSETAEITGYTKKTVNDALKSLVERGLLMKSASMHRGQNTVDYVVNMEPVIRIKAHRCKNYTDWYEAQTHRYKNYTDGYKNYTDGNEKVGDPITVENKEGLLFNNIYNNISIKDKDISTPLLVPPHDKITPMSKKGFDFRKALIDNGVEPNLADAWLQIRKKKGASNSEFAFNALVREVNKAGITIAEGVLIAVENSWRGFDASWYFRLRGGAVNNADNGSNINDQWAGIKRRKQ